MLRKPQPPLTPTSSNWWLNSFASQMRHVLQHKHRFHERLHMKNQHKSNAWCFWSVSPKLYTSSSSFGWHQFRLKIHCLFDVSIFERITLCSLQLGFSLVKTMQQTLNLTPDRNTKPHWSNAWPSSSDDPPHVPLLLLNTKFDLICLYSQILCFLAKTLDMWHLYTQISIEGAKKVSTATGNFYGKPEFNSVLLQA